MLICTTQLHFKLMVNVKRLSHLKCGNCPVWLFSIERLFSDEPGKEPIK